MGQGYGVAMSCGVGHRRGSDPALLWVGFLGCCSFVCLGLHLRQMGVPKLGAELELQL